MTGLTGAANQSRAVPLTVAFFVAVALLLGLLLAADAWPVAIGLIALLCSPFVLYAALSNYHDTNGKLLLGGWALMLVSSAFAQHGLPIGYLIEAGLLVLGISAARQTLALVKTDVSLRVCLLAFVGFLVIGLLSTLMGRSRMLAAAWQVLYIIKFPLMFMCGMLIVWNDRSRNMYDLIVRWSWVPLLLFVVIEIAAPGVHEAILGPRPDFHGNPMLGIGLRYRGLTQHPGSLAVCAGLLAACAIVNWLLDRQRRSWLFVTAMYGVLVLSTGERQETMGMVLAVLVIVAIRLRRHWAVAASVGGLLCGAAIVFVMLSNHVPHLSVLDDWGFGDPLVVLSERGVLYKGGFQAASRYFPWGAGFGTYGGVGAQKFDVSLSIDMGFERYWWFRQRMFLVDTYWPGVIAETGVLGFLFQMAFFVVMLLTLFWRAAVTEGTTANAVVLYAIASLTLMLSNSPSSIQLTDPRMACLFWLLIGAAWRASSPVKLPLRGRQPPAPDKRDAIAGMD